MADLQSIASLSFPNYPSRYLQDTAVRHAYAKASAYVTIALDTAEVEHSRSKEAAAVTDATHELAEDKVPEQYLELAVQELAFAEAEVDTEFQEKLKSVRQQLQKAI